MENLISSFVYGAIGGFIGNWVATRFFFKGGK